MITYKDFGVQKETATLSNGVKVLHFRKKNAPISITFASKSGSRYDPDGKEGLAHLLEHSVLLGSEKFKDKKDLTYFIEGVGGNYGAYTTAEFTAFSFYIGDKIFLPHIKTAIEEVFNNAKFEESKIVPEKNVISNEIDRNQNSTSYHLYRGVLKLMLKDHPLTKEIVGNNEALLVIKREDLLKHYKNKFQQNIHIFSCGDVSIEKITSLFEGVLPNKKINSNIKSVNILKINGGSGVFKKDIKTPNVEIGFPVCNLSDYEEYVSLKLLTNLLGRGRNSLLMDKFRTNENILYEISAASHIQEDFGHIHIDFQIKKEKIPYVLENINSILKNIREGVLDEKLVEFTKDRIINGSKIFLQTSDSWVDYHIRRALLVDDSKTIIFLI